MEGGGKEDVSLVTKMIVRIWKNVCHNFYHSLK